MFKKIKNLFGVVDTNETIKLPMEGEVVPVTEVSDPTFGEEIVGKGIAIKPSSGRVLAPVNGTVSTVFETKHAITMISDQGAEILIHIGLDTVKLRGQFFNTYVVSGQKINVGDLMIDCDLEAIKNAGYDTITPMVVCNMNLYQDISFKTGFHKEMEAIITLKR